MISRDKVNTATSRVGCRRPSLGHIWMFDVGHKGGMGGEREQELRAVCQIVEGSVHPNWSY